MNAVEFVQERGIDRVKELVNECPIEMLYIGKCGFSKLQLDKFACKKDLKQIVDAFELVDWHGGLKYAKSYFERNSKQYPDHYAGWSELEQAIQLVEQCQ